MLLHPLPTLIAALHFFFFFFFFFFYTRLHFARVTFGTFACAPAATVADYRAPRAWRWLPSHAPHGYARLPRGLFRAPLLLPRTLSMPVYSWVSSARVRLYRQSLVRAAALPMRRAPAFSYARCAGSPVKRLRDYTRLGSRTLHTGARIYCLRCHAVALVTAARVTRARAFTRWVCWFAPLRRGSSAAHSPALDLRGCGWFFYPSSVYWFAAVSRRTTRCRFAPGWLRTLRFQHTFARCQLRLLHTVLLLHWFTRLRAFTALHVATPPPGFTPLRGYPYCCGFKLPLPHLPPWFNTSPQFALQHRVARSSHFTLCSYPHPRPPPACFPSTFALVYRCRATWICAR